MDTRQQSGSGFINGLLLGIVLGAGIVLLFTSNKGRRILKIMSEDGFDSINNLDDLYQKLEAALKDDDAVTQQSPKQPDVRTLIAQDLPVATPVAQAPVIVTPEVKLHAEAEIPTPLIVSPHPVAEVIPAPTPSVIVAPVPQPVPAVSMPIERPVADPVLVSPQPEAVKTPEPAPVIASPEKQEIEEPYVKKSYIVAVDAQTSSKFAEVQKRLDEEIESVSESIAQKFIAYADDEIEALEDIEVASKTSKVKPARRRFFRGINRRA